MASRWPFPRSHVSTFSLGLWLLALAGCAVAPSASSVSAWIVGEDQAITVDSAPVPENDLYSAARKSLRLTAAVNETVAFQIGLRAQTLPVAPLNVRVSDLTGPGGALAARSIVSIYRAQYVRVDQFRSWYPEHTGRPATPTEFPDILVPWDAPRGGGPLALDKPRNEIIWIDLAVPRGTEPGEYVGRVELAAAAPPATGFSLGGRPAESPAVFQSEIRLKVLPAVLPSERSLPVICRFDPRPLLAEHLRWPQDRAEETRLLTEAPSHQPAIRLVNAAMQLFHENRLTPVLWASFPKFQLTDQGTVDVQWDEYDRLVSGWLDGEAFADRVGLARWPMPVSLEYPDAERNGGFRSPRYARLLAAYLAECKRHFEERGWLERAFVRVNAPANLTPDAIDQVRRVAGILKQGEIDSPLVAHLPARSLRGMGWYNAPAIELPDVDIWSPPAMWYEPEALKTERGLGKQTWFMPGHPPYAGALVPEALPSDACILPWQAYRYGAQAVWIEQAASWDRPATGSPEGARPAALLYPGTPYGLPERPVGSIRLKRLRRGAQDYELLRLLEKSGGGLLARTTAEQIVRWAFTEACLDNLLDTAESGWADAATALPLARELLAQELANAFEPNATGEAEQLNNLARWGRLMNQATRISAEVRGVRLSQTEEGLRAHVFTALQNRSNRPIHGQWRLPDPPVGWQRAKEFSGSAAPNARQLAEVELALAGLAYNPEGVTSFSLNLDAEEFGTLTAPARLAVAACPFVEKPPVIDGDLSDWGLATNNAAGDFRLCRGLQTDAPGDPNAAASGRGQGLPALPTQAMFCMDPEHLYVAVRCGLKPGETPLWRADNIVPIDGNIPWGQDVVEILLNPQNLLQGTSGDLFILQIKPNGLLVARKGCRTDPPMGPSEEWQSGARVSVSLRADAWTVELSLPLAALGKAAVQNKLWGCNVTRLDARRGEYSSWSAARGYCYSPQSTGNLVLLRP